MGPGSPWPLGFHKVWLMGPGDQVLAKQRYTGEDMLEFDMPNECTVVGVKLLSSDGQQLKLNFGAMKFVSAHCKFWVDLHWSVG